MQDEFILKRGVQIADKQNIKMVEQTKYVLFYGKNYSIKKPTDWLIQQKDETYTIFTGPKVGPLKVGFYIRILENHEGDYLHAAEQLRALQAKQAKHHIIEERDMSQKNFDALMRYSTWYNHTENIMMYVREIFTERNGKIYILSSSVPNTPHLQMFDNIFIYMFNSFKYNTLSAKNN